jgi:hypothetical protein
MYCDAGARINSASVKPFLFTGFSSAGAASTAFASGAFVAFGAGFFTAFLPNIVQAP